MLGLQKIDHVGLRIGDRDKSLAFYEKLGFELVSDAVFDNGHPIIMQHPSGLVLNLLGPATRGQGENILMDVADKYPGYTHVAFNIDSVEDAEALFEKQGIAITGRRKFRGGEALFIRDPDRNVLELVGPGPSITDLISDQMHASPSA